MRMEAQIADAGASEVAIDSDAHSEDLLWALLAGDGGGLCEPTGAGRPLMDGAEEWGRG